MKDKILKIKLIYVPFLLLSVGFIVIYTFLHWFLILKLQLFEIDEDVINYLIPFSVVWIPFVVIFKKRLKLLDLRWSKRGIDPLRISIASIATLIATSFAQDYMRTAAGELSQLNSVEQIDKTHLTKYYQFDKIYLVKKWREIYWFSDVKGKQMENLDFEGYFVTPILSCPADTNKAYFSTWYAIKYLKRINNRLLKPEKDKEWQEFKTRTIEEFDQANLYKPIYFERLGKNLDQKRFLETIQFRNDYDHSMTPIILKPVDEAFELRNNDNLQAIIIFYGIFALAMLLMILIPSFNEEELNKFLSRNKPLTMKLTELFKSKLKGVIDADTPNGTTKLLDKYSKLKESESLVFKHANIEYTIHNQNFTYKISDNAGHIFHEGPYDDNVIIKIMNFSQASGTFTDTRDGKVYKTIKIGNQTWFAENLSYKVNSGCWAYDNNSSNAFKYGYLYSWETAKTVCPAGWHLPSEAEWKTLINFLGGENLAGGKMKATTDWQYDADGNATNEFGFNALPAGYRSNDGLFHNLVNGAFFWSSSSMESENAWGIGLGCLSGKVGQGRNYRSLGFSIRCIKD